MLRFYLTQCKSTQIFIKVRNIFVVITKYCAILLAFGVFGFVVSNPYFLVCRLEVGYITVDSLWRCPSIEAKAFVDAQYYNCGLG